ncbi:hypothetical protein [Acetobacter vaccinii]|nr:hypothetical protein [Acetobacter vaccinii]
MPLATVTPYPTPMTPWGFSKIIKPGAVVVCAYGFSIRHTLYPFLPANA